MQKITRMTAERLAEELCKQEGFDVKDASDFAEDMLTRLLAGQVVGEEDANNKLPHVIQAQKIRLRHWYILLVYETGKRNLPTDLVLAYSKRFDVTTDWIIKGDAC